MTDARYDDLIEYYFFCLEYTPSGRSERFETVKNGPRLVFRAGQWNFRPRGTFPDLSGDAGRLRHSSVVKFSRMGEAAQPGRVCHRETGQGKGKEERLGIAMGDNQTRRRLGTAHLPTIRGMEHHRGR